MAVKLGKGEFPSGHVADDFICFGPPATKDGEFETVYMADLGCFNQEGVDSNKYYCGQVCQSKKNQKFYAYFEWGRTGKTGDVQFVECSSKEEAHSVFAKQMHEKNDKRGEWATIAGRKILRAKSGKDCYLVRPQAKRTVGLPDAQKIVHDDSGNLGKKVLSSSTPKLTSKKYDSETIQLMKDLTGGAVNFARANLEGGSIPMQSAIDEARDILDEAQKRVGKVGNDVEDQVKDKQLKQLSYTLYSRIPKTKAVGAPESDWILSGQNIQNWRFDLDVFEDALQAIDIGAGQSAEYNPFEGSNIEMIHLPLNTMEGDFVNKWMPSATNNRHGHVGKIRIKNIWGIRQIDLLPRFKKTVERIGQEKINTKETPLFQPHRSDISKEEYESFKKAHVNILFHGTRSINTGSIIKTGFRLPKQLSGVSINGALFGEGIYSADDVKKSVQYTSLPHGGYYTSGSGVVKGREAFMFIIDAAIGNPYVAKYTHGNNGLSKGYHSIFGKAGVSGVVNNEWILPTIEQVNIRYLVEFNCI